MVESGKLAIRASEIRTKLAALAGAEGDLSDEAKAEIGTLRTEYQDVEVRFQAASTAEDVKETKSTESSPEANEYRALVDKAELGAIYAATLEHRNTDGAEAELQSHLKISGRTKSRLTCLRSRATGRLHRPRPMWAQVSNPLFSAVFANSVGSFLGVDQPTVGRGRCGIIRSSPQRAERQGAHSPVQRRGGRDNRRVRCGTACKPERIAGVAISSSAPHAARFGGMSSALRENLSDGVGAMR